MNNDEVREILDSKGITVKNVTDDQVKILHSILSENLTNSGCFRGSFKINKLDNTRYLTCASDYFVDREAVSFNSDGFIGFAGWADSKNVQPILKSVVEWANKITLGEG